MKLKKRILWSDDIDLADWREYYDFVNDEDQQPKDDDELYRWAVEDNALQLDELRFELNTAEELRHVCDDGVVIFGTLGLWTGPTPGYRLLVSTDIGDCFQPTLKCQSACEWYIDELGDLRLDEAHHDGVNHYTYRVWKPGLSKQQIQNFCSKLYWGEATRKDINRYTRSLGKPIAKYYGV